MRKGCLIGLVLLLGLGVTAVLSYWAFPRAVAALPAQVRLYLPEEVIRAANTPLPTALPAPKVSPQPLALIPTLSFPTPTLPATFTAVPSAATPITTTLPSTDNRSPITPTPSPPPPPLPAQIRLDGLTVIPQKFNNCGPANLTMNLAYYGHAVQQLDVAAQIRPAYEDRNVTPWELVGYVNEQTPLRAAVYSGGDLETLKRLLANGYPVIIEKGYEPNDWQGWMGHYLTLIGYDETTREFITLDTFLGPWDSSGRRETYEFIENYWQHFNNTFYLVYPPDEETAVHALLGPTFTDRLTMWQQAAQIAQGETALLASSGQATTPTNPYPYFNLGTSLTQLAQLTGEQSYYENAAVAFDQARTIGLPWRMLWYQFQAYEAYLAVGRTADVLILANATLSSGGGQEEAYYYRGLAYLAQGYPEQARLDFQQAISWNPTFSPAQEALEKVSSEQ